MPTMKLTADQRAALEPLADILGGIYGQDAVKLLGGEDDAERNDLIADIVGGAFAAQQK